MLQADSAPGGGLAVRTVPVASLHADPANARKHDERNLQAIADSLAAFGQVEPLVVQAGTGKVIGGNGRLEVLRRRGDTHVAVVEVEVDDARAAALGIALNRTAELAEWDDGTLAKLLASLPADLKGVAGFNDGDLSELLDRLAPKEVVEDEPPAPLAEAVSRRGDLWLMGGHRLLCGDSTDRGDVALVMNGERAGLMNTDPPYGIAYDNAALGPTRREYAAIDNDAKEGAASQAFLESVFRAAVDSALKANAAWYLWHAMLSQGFFAAAAAAAANVVLHRQIIWVKPRLILGRGQYHWRHELCYFGWVAGQPCPDYGRGDGERDQTTVWEIAGVPDSDRREYEHATPKPLGLFTTPITKHLRLGEICYEPFCGSGPQIVAAEQLARKCYAIEIEPRYVDVAVRRWEKLTGKQATLEGSGSTWADVAAERGVAIGSGL